jgi:hypothetical protein
MCWILLMPSGVMKEFLHSSYFNSARARGSIFFGEMALSAFFLVFLLGIIRVSVYFALEAFLAVNALIFLGLYLYTWKKVNEKETKLAAESFS